MRMVKCYPTKLSSRFKRKAREFAIAGNRDYCPRMAKHLYDPTSAEPFRLSRSKLSLFLDCPRCFYLDRRAGVGRPDTPPFTLNNAVDLLLKREFDAYRAEGKPHPIMLQYGIDAVPFSHPQIDHWREALRGGVAALHPATNLLLTGAPDDIWRTTAGELIVVDYKATSTEKGITLDDPWKVSYKRQVETYQWLLRRNGFTVSPTAYFVYANAHRARSAFDRALTFDLSLHPYGGDDSWVDDALTEAHACLQLPSPPPSTEQCEWCAYRREAKQHEQ